MRPRPAASRIARVRSPARLLVFRRNKGLAQKINPAGLANFNRPGLAAGVIAIAMALGFVGTMYFFLSDCNARCVRKTERPSLW